MHNSSTSTQITQIKILLLKRLLKMFWINCKNICSTMPAFCLKTFVDSKLHICCVTVGYIWPHLTQTQIGKWLVTTKVLSHSDIAFSDFVCDSILSWAAPAPFFKNRLKVNSVSGRENTESLFWNNYPWLCVTNRKWCKNNLPASILPYTKAVKQHYQYFSVKWG